MLPNHFSIITADSPKFKPKNAGGSRALEEKLKQKGYKYEKVSGKYDDPTKTEEGFLVHNPNTSHINKLGEEFGQASVLHSHNNHHKLYYTSGKNKGYHHKGEGITIHDKEPKNYYSTVTRGDKKTHFTLNFDFDKLHKTDPILDKLTLLKGAMQRLAPFKPQRESDRPSESQEENIANWQGMEGGHEDYTSPRAYREAIGPMEGAVRMRALHKLHSATQVRRTKDGGREFLLHRGMSSNEYNKKAKDKTNINHTIRSSWTPNKGVAANLIFGNPGGKIASAWVHEKHIVHVPKQLGAVSSENQFDYSGRYKPPQGPNRFSPEHEVIIEAGHNSPNAARGEMAKSKGYITFPGLGAGQRTQTSPYKSTEHLKQAVHRFDPSGKSNKYLNIGKWATGFTSYRASKDKPIPYPKRRSVSGVVSGSPISIKYHEEQHGIFQNIAENHGEILKQKTASHLIYSLPSEHRKTVLKIMGQGLEKYPKENVHEEMISRMHNYLNEADWRDEAHMNAGINSPKGQILTHNTIKQAFEHMRNTAKNMKLEDLQESPRYMSKAEKYTFRDKSYLGNDNKTTIDHGPKNWKPSKGSLTRVDTHVRVPVSLLRDPSKLENSPYRTYEGIARNESKHTTESINKLTEDIKQHGIKEKLTLGVEPSGKITIIEGTHRVMIAEKLGHSHVPAQVRYFELADKNHLLHNEPHDDEIKKVVLNTERDQDIFRDNPDLEGNIQSKAHGWISPEGEYHHMTSNEDHDIALKRKHGLDVKTAYEKGWLSIGHGGGYNIQGHSDAINNPNHPATVTARKLADKYFGEKVGLLHAEKYGVYETRPWDAKNSKAYKEVSTKSFVAGTHNKPQSQIAQWRAGIFDKSILNKLQTLRKEYTDYAKAPREMHGWISPDGNFHQMQDKERHHDVARRIGAFEERGNLKHGYIGLGIAGYPEGMARISTLRDAFHPAMKTFKRKLKENGMSGNYKMWVDGSNFKLSKVDIDIDHFIKHGNIKSGLDYYDTFNKSILNKLQNLKKAIGKTMPTIYIIRHGETAYNKDENGQERLRGWLDIPLDERGKTEATRIGKDLKGIGIQKIYCSDLIRTQETANLIVKEFEDQTPIIPNDKFRPWNLGFLQGELVDKIKDQILYLQKRKDEVPKNGESFNAFLKRFESGLKDVMKQCQEKSETIAIVAHYRNLIITEAMFKANWKLENIADEDIRHKDLRTGAVLKLEWLIDHWKLTSIE